MKTGKVRKIVKQLNIIFLTIKNNKRNNQKNSR